MSRILSFMKRNQLFVFIFLPVIYLVLLSPKAQHFDEKLDKDGIGVLPLAMHYVKRYYVDQSAVNPKTMLVGGLEKLERSLDEVLVDFPNRENSSFFKVQVMNEEKSFDMTGVSDLRTLSDKMEEAFKIVVPRLVSKDTKATDIEYAVTDEMLKTLDPYSGIITPQVYQEFTIETEGSFGGLGIVIGIRDGQLTVIAPIDGTPAYKVGIEPNDRIVQIEDESTVNMSLIEAVGKLRGPKGTAVNIYVGREGLSEAKKFSIVRDIINIQSVEAFNLSDGVIYVRIRDFQKNTLSSLRESLQNYRENGKVKGIILDLRGNPGGLLDQAERISDLFLRSGVIVTTKIGDSKKPYNAKEEDYDFHGKIVVLVDSGSASASEIVAGAIKNNDRGVVIGERTFGKGTVQQIFDLNDGSALKLTIADYLTPGDISIQDTGITPDISLDPTVVSKDLINFNSANSSLNLDNGERGKPKKKSSPVDKSLYSITYLDTPELKGKEEEPTPEEALSREEKRNKLEKDFYVTVARQILLSSDSSLRKNTLNEVKNTIGRISDDEGKKIENKWQEIGVDWSLDGTVAGVPKLSVKIEPKNLKVKAGDKIEVVAEVENTGTAPIYRLSALSKSDDPIFNGKEFIFGKLNPGEKRSWNATFEIPKWTLTREDSVSLKFEDASRTALPDFNFRATIEQLPRPVFGFNYEIVDDGRYGSSGNGNGISEVGETIGLFVRLKNIGQGFSEETVLSIKNLSGDKIFLQKGRFQLKGLNPGETKEATLVFSVKKPDPKIDMELQVLDEVSREGIASKIYIPENSKQISLVKKSLNITVSKDSALIRGGSFVEAPVLGVSEKGSAFEAIGEYEQWVKIKLDEHLIGWLNKEDIAALDSQAASSGDSPFKEVFEEPPYISISRPPLTTNSQEVILNGFIRDKDGIQLVSVFVGEDKKILLPSNEKEIPISLRVKLEEGVNLVTVFAKNSRGLFSRETFVVRSGA
ncbi:MAG: MXAN_5808 family serine peptidase [Thermodesulfobacteriota bacterium]